MAGIAAQTERPQTSNLDLWGSAIQEIPSAVSELSHEAWEHKEETAVHVVKELATSAVIGAGIGYIVPSKGPAAMLVSAAFTVPMALNAYWKLSDVSQQAKMPGADIQQLAHGLARDTVSGAGNLALDFAGGIGGTKGGIWLAKSDTAAGAFAQWGQRQIIRGENNMMIAARSKFDAVRNSFSSQPHEAIDLTFADAHALTGNRPLGIADTRLNQRLENALGSETQAKMNDLWFFQRPFAKIQRRLDQHSLASGDTLLTAAQRFALQLFYGSTHGHSRYSDGMGLPIDLYKKAIAKGQQVTSITDHNHLAARDGVKPGDPRAEDQKGTPVVAAAPEEYVQTQADAAATTIPGKHVSLFGIEMGTIGGVHHVHDGRPHGPKISEGDTAAGPEDHDHGSHHDADQAGANATEGRNGQVEPDSKPEDGKVVLGTETPPPTETATAASEPSPNKTDGSVKPHDNEAVPPAGAPPAEKPATGDTVEVTTSAIDIPDLDRGTQDLRDAVNHTPAEPGRDAQRIDEPENLMPYDFKAAQLESLEAEHLGGVNHINILDVPTFFEAIRKPRPRVMQFFASLVGMDTHVTKAPEVVKYNDGDYKAMVGHLDSIKDSMGKPVIATLNHPRFMADNNASLPAAQRGRDYGRKSFKNDDEWRERFVKPYVRGIELIKGGALNPNPVDKVPTGMIDLKSYVGYLGLGVEAGPVFGRDFHFGDPVGNPGSTGFLAASLDKAGILDAMRERRIMASTNFEKLNGFMMANDKFYMGSILDQNAVHDLNLKMKMTGDIDPQSTYTMKLYADAKVLDGVDAAVVQTKKVTGQELIDAQGEFSFDQVNHKLGDNSLYFTEVNKTEADGNVEKMWTSPIWVQPLAGDKHGVVASLSAGGLTQVPNWLFSPTTVSVGSVPH